MKYRERKSRSDFVTNGKRLLNKKGRDRTETELFMIVDNTI